MDDPVEESSADGLAEDAQSTKRRERSKKFVLQLRTLSLILVVVGFVGAIAEGSAPITPETAFSYVFAAGIAGALVSVYLGIFLHDGADEFDR
ncbi:hypothetical protein [Halovivax gelatinilyticus]|uniref:hypothetical protein n=1 Tax=Halovivax gelatinilyticus TaxID=2961597 RepID=UPI0020CA2D21|nr:hypothetical protein [Halovivax gelatinilyticus]